MHNLCKKSFMSEVSNIRGKRIIYVTSRVLRFLQSNDQRYVAQQNERKLKMMPRSSIIEFIGFIKHKRGSIAKKSVEKVRHEISI